MMRGPEYELIAGAIPDDHARPTEPESLLSSPLTVDDYIDLQH